MRASPPRALFVAVAAALAMAAGAAPLRAAGPELPSDAGHRGIISFDEYQLFPENRPGNAVYLNNRLVVSLPGATIIDLKALSRPGRFAYLARDGHDRVSLGVHLPPTDPAPRIKKVAENFFFVVMVIDGVVIKKLYRVTGAAFQDLLPTSKTADGVTPSETGVVFYHISAVRSEEQDGRTVNIFSLRLHLALYQEERLRHLDYPIFNSLPRLNLVWYGDTGIEYELADGRVEVVSISQFQ